MTNQEYEQKKRECWEEYKQANLVGEVQWQPVSRYDVFCDAFDRAFALGKQFGNSDFSDADGAEILCVSRKRVQEMYAANERIKADFPDKETAHISDHINHVLKHLFGSKCLPDNVESSEPNVDSLHDNVDSLPQNPTENCDNKSHISADCNKPAEPKFKPNDKVIFENVVCTIMQVCYEDSTYSLMKDETGAFVAWVAESDLEPYTEPTDFGREVNFPTKKQSRNLSQNCDNRLQIAAMAMQGILSNGNAIQYAINNFRLQDGSRNRYQAVAECSLAFADALIAESEKRSGHGK